MSNNRDPSKKRQPCVKKREIVKLIKGAFRLARYIWLAYRSADLIDLVVEALLGEDTGPLDHYLIPVGDI